MELMRNNLFIIAQSGWKYIAVSLTIFVLFIILDCSLLAILSFIITLALLYVFKNPERELMSFEEDSIVSPVDGVVSSITELENSEYAYRVDIESGYMDVSLLRVPIQAHVQSIKFQKGTRVSKKSKLVELLNENVEIVFVHTSGSKIMVKHTLTRSFAPLDIGIFESQNLLKTTRYGLMLTGVTSLYLPANVRLNLNVASELKASESLIGFFS